MEKIASINMMKQLPNLPSYYIYSNFHSCWRANRGNKGVASVNTRDQLVKRGDLVGKYIGLLSPVFTPKG
jgi:hypothetical protein